MNKQNEIFATTLDLLDAGNLKKMIKGFSGESVAECVIDDIATKDAHILSGLCDPQSSPELINTLVTELQAKAQNHAYEIAQLIHGEDRE